MPEAEAQSWMARRTAVPFHKLVVCLAIVIASLSSCRVESPAEAYEHVWSLYTNGALPDAAEAARTKSLQFNKPAQADWYWRFRLLQAEALLAQGNVRYASPLIQDPIPG